MFKFCGILFCGDDVDAIMRTVAGLRAVRGAEGRLAIALLFEKKRHLIVPAMLRVVEEARDGGAFCFFGAGSQGVAREVLDFARKKGSDVLLFLRAGDEPVGSVLRRLYYFFVENAEACGLAYLPRLAEGEALPEAFCDLPPGSVVSGADGRALPVTVPGAAVWAEDAFAAASDGEGGLSPAGAAGEEPLLRLLRGVYERKGRFGLLARARVTISAANPAANPGETAGFSHGARGPFADRANGNGSAAVAPDAPVAPVAPDAPASDTGGPRKFAVSCIIPVHNVERYLAEAADSVIAQTVGFEENVQLILVNDGSTDGSGEICRSYLERFPENVVCVEREHGGASAARNAGLDVATGEYVAFLDGDGKFDATYFEKADQLLKNRRNAFLTVGIGSVREEPAAGGETDPGRAEAYAPPSGLLNYSFPRTASTGVDANSHFIHTCLMSVIFRRDLAEGVRFADAFGVFDEADFLHGVLLKHGEYCFLHTAKNLKRDCGVRRWREECSGDELDFLLRLAGKSEKAYGRVTKYTKYLMYGVLIELQHTPRAPWDLDKEKFAAVAGCLDDIVIRFAFNKAERLDKWAHNYILTSAGYQSRHTVSDTEVLLSDFRETDGVFSFTGEYSVPCGLDFKLLTVNAKGEIVPSASSEIEYAHYLGFPVAERRRFTVETAAEKTAAFTLYALHPNMTVEKVSCGAAEADGTAGWFRSCGSLLVCGNKERNGFVIEPRTTESLTSAAVSLINASFRAQEYEDDAMTVRHCLRLMSLDKVKRDVVMVNAIADDAAMREIRESNADSAVYRLSQASEDGAPDAHDAVEYGSREHKLFSLLAKKVYAPPDAGDDGVFPYAAVAHGEFNEVYRGLAAAELVTDGRLTAWRACVSEVSDG
jgi:glycosyltransferase involved in cell wall biosynthesis